MRIEKRKREQEFIEEVDSLKLATARQMEENRNSFTTKLQEAMTERIFVQQNLERLVIERDKLARHNKKLRSSFLCKPTEENIKATVKSPDRPPTDGKHSAVEEARSDYRAGDVDLRAEQKRSEFASRLGNRLGSVKYAEWLKTQQMD